MRALLAFSLFAALGSRVGAANLGPLPVAYCPNVDGSAVGPEGGALGPFQLMSGNGEPEAQTTVRIGRDNANLYLHATCAEPLMDRVRADSRPGSSEVWTDDCVEIFIQPSLERKQYAHLIINAAGVTQDNLPRERPVKYEWAAAASRGKAWWAVEVRIPFKDLDAPVPTDGDAWRFNFCRSRIPKAEASCWSATGKQFHVPDRFGVLVFGDPSVQVDRITTGLGDLGPHRSFEARLVGADAERVSGSLTLTPEGGDPATVPLVGRTAEDGTRLLEASYETPKAGKYRLAVRVGDPGAKQVVLNTAFEANVAGEGLCSAIYPAEDDNNRLYVAKGTIQHFFFVPANHSERTFDKFRFVLVLPEGIEVTQATGPSIEWMHRPMLLSREAAPPLTAGGERMVKWVWESDHSLGPSDIKKLEFWQSWCGALVASPKVGLGSHKFAFWLEAGDEREQEHVGELVVIPEPKGRQPEDIVIGMSCWTISPTPEFWRELIATYKKCGINLVDSHMLTKGDEFLRPALDAGMRRWVLLWWFWWNAEYLKAHPDHAAVHFDGKPDEQTVCPEIVASEDNNAVEEPMKNIVANVKSGAIEGTWWDLEGPGTWDICFCPRCIAAFRKAAKIPDEVELTPQKIQDEYPSQWIAFACGQNARIAARMKAYARANGAPDWKLAVYSGVQSDFVRTHYRIDWDLITPEIDVAALSLYSIGPGDLREFFTTTPTHFERYIKAIKDIPVWGTISTGFGRNTHYISDGRLTRMQLIKPIAFGMQGVAQWWWGPVDGRHYAAYAEASRLVSGLEDFFTKGKMDTEFLSGEPTRGTTRVAWRLGDEVLVMLFNDGPERRVWARAQVPDGYRLLRDDGKGRLRLQGATFRASVEPLDCRWAIIKL
jgi:hypothetical protein